MLLLASADDVLDWAFHGHVIALGHVSDIVTSVECCYQEMKTCKLDYVGLQWD